MTTIPGDLSHLQPAHRPYALLADAERVDWIRQERWINYTRAEQVLVRLGELLRYPPRHRMPALLLFGATGMGKTRIIERFLRENDSHFDEVRGTTRLPVVALQMPPTPHERDFYEELLVTMEAVLPVGLSSTNLRQRVRVLARQLEVRMLVIDEIHAMLSGTFHEQRIFLNCLRFLANDLHLPLVCVGIKLDLARVFPGRQLNWFVHGNGAPSSGRNSGGGSVWWLAFMFCPRCLHQQIKDGLPIHRRAEWTLAFLTHCPQHQDEPLRHYCLCCHREEPRWVITPKGKDEEVQCRHCGTALHHWPRGTIDRFSPSLQLTLRLESTILRSLSGQAPDPFWVGNVDAETFANLVSELFSLLAEPDRQGVLALADHLGGEDWWDKHRLGYGVVTTVASLQHWASRLKMVASVAKYLLGERSLQFFRFRGPRCVGQRDLYPFAILFRELPVDRQELIRRAMRWPDPLADQIARVLKR